MASADGTLADVPPNSPAPVATPAPAKPAVPRGVVLAILAVLLYYVGSQGWALWREWSQLQDELGDARKAAVIGYYNIHISPSYAQKPKTWHYDEGDQTLLWSGWKDGQGHLWFRIGRGELDLERISEPMGRDVVKAIDVPIVEVGGGTIWRRIPEAADVAGHELGGVHCVYPLLLLDKVEVVNDVIAEQPFLVTYNPFRPKPERVTVYAPVVEGERVRMGVTGYFHEGRLMLYDRATESLWVDREEGLQAVAGARRGALLRRIAHPAPTHWGDWRARHPHSRLIVGADRSREAS